MSRAVRHDVTDRRGAFLALCGDDQAFTAWYETALPVVYGFSYGRTGGDAMLAEDVTAQAFLEAIRALEFPVDLVV